HQSSARLGDSQAPVKSFGRLRPDCALRLGETTQVQRHALSPSPHRSFSLDRLMLRVPLERQMPASACSHTSWYSSRMRWLAKIGNGACDNAIYIVGERNQDSVINFHLPVTAGAWSMPRCRSNSTFPRGPHRIEHRDKRERAAICAAL